MKNCELCPKKCGVNRNEKPGFCGVHDKIIIGRVALHMWEEPCISGKNGSGTVFFCGCTMGCVYCQNYLISRKGGKQLGREVDENQLSALFLRLQHQGAHNINLVTPTMFVYGIKEAIGKARSNGLTIPIVYNTSGYENVLTLMKLDDMIDVYLPDFKSISEETAKRYSNAADYPDHAKISLDHMVKKNGCARFDNSGMMTKGVIVRHLLLPGQLSESKAVLDYLYSTYGNDIHYSLMSQYTPTDGLDKEKYPELARRVTTYEYNKLIDYALCLGIKNGFTQEREAAKESFIPVFGTDL